MLVLIKLSSKLRTGLHDCESLRYPSICSHTDQFPLPYYRCTFHCSSLQKAQSIIARVKKPTEAEAKALASCFPSTTTRKRSLEPSFDLSADCVALPQQKKKKSTSQGRLKLTTLTVVVMKKYERAIPRGKRRQQLSSEGRVRPVKLSRSMSPLQVKNAILCAFEGVISNFTVLECDQCGHNLFCRLSFAKMVQHLTDFY